MKTNPFHSAIVKMEGQAIQLEITDSASDYSGPWQDEPNEVMLEHAGYVCELKRNPSMGFWLAYVYVGEEHPLFKSVDQDDSCDFLNVHGGVTYHHGGKIGFDCGHAGDMSPYASWNGGGAEVYRTVEFVTNEVKSLAQQLRNYDTAYHRKMFVLAEKLEKRALAIRKAMHKKGK